eukprot:4288156-Lingulodinium_polyedra.AAC.1
MDCAWTAHGLHIERASNRQSTSHRSKCNQRAIDAQWIGRLTAQSTNQCAINAMTAWSSVA